MTEPNILKLDNYSVPWFQYGNDQTSQNIHFSPANGIPAASYASFFSQLGGRFNISTMDSRGAWENIGSPDESLSFEDYADDLITALQIKYKEPVIGIGHSLGGAITILAAIKRPELFSKIVLIDPASTPSKFADFMFQILPKSLKLKLFPFIRGSLERRSVWDSRQQFFDNYRNHKTFELFTDLALRDYALHGLKECSNNQFELIFSPEWEAFNFHKVYFLWDHLVKLKNPTLFLRADQKSLYSEETFDRHNSRLGGNVIARTLPETSHLMTHENTDLISSTILEWLTK